MESYNIHTPSARGIALPRNSCSWDEFLRRRTAENINPESRIDYEGKFGFPRSMKGYCDPSCLEMETLVELEEWEEEDVNLGF